MDFAEKGNSRKRWMNSGPMLHILFFMTGRLRGQDLFILVDFSFCWGHIIWSWTQINHQKTADPQNIAFGGFYTHITRNRRALWVVHSYINAHDIHPQQYCTVIGFISAFKMSHLIYNNTDCSWQTDKGLISSLWCIAQIITHQNVNK